VSDADDDVARPFPVQGTGRRCNATEHHVLADRLFEFSQVADLNRKNWTS
jgi:hypothetical protein